MSSNLNFSVSGKSISATKLLVSTRQFSFIVDEPPALGGTDDGANPVEYLLGSYAGCLNVVFYLVAASEGITIHSLSIQVNGNIDPAKLFGTSKINRAGFHDINVAIEIDSDASEAALADLLHKVKERCPINDNLTNVTPVRYTIVQPQLAGSLK